MNSFAGLPPYRINREDHGNRFRRLHDEAFLRGLHVLLEDNQGHEGARGSYGGEWHVVGGRGMAPDQSDPGVSGVPRHSGPRGQRAAAEARAESGADTGSHLETIGREGAAPRARAGSRRIGARTGVQAILEETARLGRSRAGAGRIGQARTGTQVRAVQVVGNQEAIGETGRRLLRHRANRHRRHRSDQRHLSSQRQTR